MTTGTDQAMLDRHMRAFADMCRRAGVRTTHQRTEVFREVARTPEHPDAESIYRRVKRRIPAISLDTVYRTLRLLEDNGLLSKVSLPGDRARFDANTDPHHHFICMKCGLVRDFYTDRLDGFRPPGEVLALGKVETVHIEVRGICKACAAR